MKRLLILCFVTLCAHCAYSQSNMIGQSREKVTQILQAKGVGFQTMEKGYIVSKVGNLILAAYFNKKDECIRVKFISEVEDEYDMQEVIENTCGESKPKDTENGVVCYRYGCKYTITFKKTGYFDGWTCTIDEEAAPKKQ